MASNAEYHVLGIHEELDSRKRPTGRKVVRARMKVKGKEIDEDFPMPRAITVEEQINTMIEARMAELNKLPNSKLKSHDEA